MGNYLFCTTTDDYVESIHLIEKIDLKSEEIVNLIKQCPSNNMKIEFNNTIVKNWINNLLNINILELTQGELLKILTEQCSYLLSSDRVDCALCTYRTQNEHFNIKGEFMKNIVLICLLLCESCVLYEQVSKLDENYVRRLRGDIDQSGLSCCEGMEDGNRELLGDKIMSDQQYLLMEAETTFIE